MKGEWFRKLLVCVVGWKIISGFAFAESYDLSAFPDSNSFAYVLAYEKNNSLYIASIRNRGVDTREDYRADIFDVQALRMAEHDKPIDSVSRLGYLQLKTEIDYIKTSDADMSFIGVGGKQSAGCPTSALRRVLQKRDGEEEVRYLLVAPAEFEMETDLSGCNLFSDQGRQRGLISPMGYMFEYASKVYLYDYRVKRLYAFPARGDIARCSSDLIIINLSSNPVISDYMEEGYYGDYKMYLSKVKDLISHSAECSE